MPIVRWFLIFVIAIFSSCVRPAVNPGQTPQGPGSTQGNNNAGGSANENPGSYAENPAALEVSRGNDVYINSGCSTCHKIGDEGGSIGPDLTRVGARMTMEEMSAFIRDPKSVRPDSKMPAQTMSDQDLHNLVRYLSMLK